MHDVVFEARASVALVRALESLSGNRYATWLAEGSPTEEAYLEGLQAELVVETKRAVGCYAESIRSGKFHGEVDHRNHVAYEVMFRG